MSEIPYLICMECGKIESTPFAENDECFCGGTLVLATDQLTALNLREERSDLKNRLQEAEGLLRRYLYESDKEPWSLIDETRAFLTPSTPTTEPDTCCGGLILSDDHTHWTCDKCGKEFAMAYTPKTEMGKKMLALREKAIAKGMTLLDEDEITGEGMVMVRREDLREIIKITERKAKLYFMGTKAIDRLKAALDGKE